MNVYEIIIPHQRDAQIIWHADRQAYEDSTYEQAVRSGCDVSEFWRDSEGYVCHHFDEGGGECACDFEYDRYSAHDLHSWELVDEDELKQIANGDHYLAQGHQGARVKRLAMEKLDMEGE